MPGYFLDNDIAATYLAARPTDTVNARPTVRGGILNPTSSSAGVTGLCGRTGATLGNAVSRPSRAVVLSSSLLDHSNTSSGLLHHHTNNSMATHLHNSVQSSRGLSRGRGRGDYRAFNSVFGRPSDLSTSGSGPRQARDEDWQPNMEAGAAMLDAPPEIRSVPAAPLSRIPSTPSIGMIRGRGRGRGVFLSRGRGKSGRGGLNFGHPSRPLPGQLSEKHPMPSAATAGTKRKGSLETVGPSGEVPMNKQQRKRARKAAERERVNAVENGPIQSGNTYKQAPLQRSLHAEPLQTSPNATEGEKTKQDAINGPQPRGTVKPEHPPSTFKRQSGNDEMRNGGAVFEIDSIPMQTDDMLVDEVSSSAVPDDRDRLPGSSEQDLQDRSAFHAPLMNGQSQQPGISPSQHQDGLKDIYLPIWTDKMQQDSLTEETRDLKQQRAFDGSCLSRNPNTTDPAPTSVGNRQEQSTTTRRNNLCETLTLEVIDKAHPVVPSGANSENAPLEDRSASGQPCFTTPTIASGLAPLDSDIMLERCVSLASDTASHSERKEYGSAKADLKGPSVPRSIDEGKAAACGESTNSQAYHPDLQIRSKDRQLPVHLKDPAVNTATVGRNDAIVSGLSATKNGSSASTTNAASVSSLSRVASSVVTDSLPKYASETHEESVFPASAALDLRNPGASGSPRAESSALPTPRKVDKGKGVMRGDTEASRESRSNDGKRPEDIHPPGNSILAPVGSARGRPAVVSDPAAHLQDSSSFDGGCESLSLASRRSVGSIANSASPSAKAIPQKKSISRRRVRITTPPDISRTSTPDSLFGTGLDTVQQGGSKTIPSGVQAVPNAMSSLNENTSASLHHPLSIASVPSESSADVVAGANAVGEKEEEVISDTEVIDVDIPIKSFGTTSFPLPPNCQVCNVPNKVELTRNRTDFELAKVVELENNYKRVQRVVWAADGMAFDWIIDRESGTYRVYWPTPFLEWTDQWIKRVVKRCRALDGGREILKVISRDEVCEVQWRKAPLRAVGLAPSASPSSANNALKGDPSFEIDIRPRRKSSASTSRRTDVLPAANHASPALPATSTLRPCDEKEDYYEDGDADKTVEEEKKSGSQPYPMPADCRTTIGIGKAIRDQNRADFVRRQKIQLENTCRKVERVFWRDDGLALDWVLDKATGVYREYWPSGIQDDLWAKGAVARWRVQQPGREVVSVTPRRDVLEIVWQRAEEVASANSKGHAQPKTAQTEHGGKRSEAAAVSNANAQTSTSIQASPVTTTVGGPAASGRPLPETTSVASAMSSPVAIPQLAHAASPSPPSRPPDQPSIVCPPDTIAQPLPIIERNSQAQQEARDIETQLASLLVKQRFWYGLREGPTDPRGRAMAQERIDILAERIETLVSRQAALQP
ncbi:hypothetical protein QFC22_003208 [Naganishia vaughanmartiniae]|uniref:Uncharacterized protein n=1 Tax=Naganishia vaughanmartiniae TaxID=1424756 RepID=A0ACC2X613_9TREE|nr:hypothetical protein QFC22_003208 [Naganishia vaughanmartiniae]